MATETSSKRQRYSIIAIDLVLVWASFYFAFLLRQEHLTQRNWDSFLSLTPWILLISVFILSIYELYNLNKKTIWDITSSILLSTTLISFLTMAASFMFRQFALPRSVIVLSFVFMVVLLSIWKISYIKLRKQEAHDRILLISNNEEAEKIIAQIKALSTAKVKVRHIQPNTALERIEEILKEVDSVMVCSNLSEENKSKIIYHAVKREKNIYVMPSLYDLLLSNAVITSFDDTMVLHVKPFGLTWDQQMLKRIMDLSISGILLLLTSPLLLLICCGVKLEDRKGEVIYRQKRIGKDNKEFTIYKFRSMIQGAESKTGPVLATKNDDRITKFGKFLRVTRLDELPQLFNVLKGDMSLVGPRPERKYFTQQYSKSVESYLYRNSVKPGITGYAQVMGKYTSDFQDKLSFDLYYIRNYSFWLDVTIMLRTIFVLIDKTKAEGRASIRQTKKKIKEVHPDAKVSQ